MTPPSPAPRRAPDLAADEAAVAGWFRAAPRAGAPASRAPFVVAPMRRASSRRLFPPLAAAAALLFALVPPVGTGAPVREPARAPVSTSVLVVDDPSVPSLHALETFEQLAWLGRPDAGNVR